MLIVSGCRHKEVRGIGNWAAIALAMMFMGPIGMGAFPAEYFGIFERFSTVAAVEYNAVLGVYLSLFCLLNNAIVYSSSALDSTSVESFAALGLFNLHIL